MLDRILNAVTRVLSVVGVGCLVLALALTSKEAIANETGTSCSSCSGACNRAKTACWSYGASDCSGSCPLSCDDCIGTTICECD